MAPGYHDTNALKRVIKKRAEVRNISYEEAKKSFADEIDVKRIGTADEFASLALWLLSPLSGYITGQTISVDGGRVKGAFG
jgi:3-oxoacyl-[acyl-carrier protein] reductase